MPARAGQSVAAALLAAGLRTLRSSVERGEPRGAFCLMGVCQDCRVRIDGVLREACLVPVDDGLIVELDLEPRA